MAKRQRFREAGLWRASEPAYYEGTFLALASTVPPGVAAALKLFEAKGEKVHSIA